MHELLDAQTVTYAFVWLVGSLAALARALRDADTRNFWRCVGAVACGGFIALSTVGVCAAHFGGHFNSRGYSLAVASFVGLAGKSLDSWIRMLGAIVLKIKLPDLSDLKDDSNKR